MGILTLSAFICYILTPSILTVIGLYILMMKFSDPYPQIFFTKKEKRYFDPVEKKFHDFPSLSEKFNKNLSVIIPAYDEESRLPKMLDECLNFLESRTVENKHFNYEVIIVNDGSRDKTSDVALEYVKKFSVDKIRLLELQTNRGKGAAVYVGVQSARGALILFADADGATKFRDLTNLESELQLMFDNDCLNYPSKLAESLAIICGSRAHLQRQATARRSLFRRILMHGFHFLVRLFAVRSIKDTQCGFKLLTRRAARLCFQSLHITRWAFDVELLYIAERYNIPILEVQVCWTEIEGSKLVPFWSWLQMGRDLFLIWFRYKIGAWKLVEKRNLNRKSD